ncbi:monooxygenase family protein [Xenorhabdus mauleonii]|uniref:3-(3-hydroxy-phenyl)propionate hydroxylase n=1 Tax=Xenorhabdus mauleonii TaxID=351675 RepID=A0A1I3PGU6_9GAMM|nr:FAD-dependent monooxygenase [Xenorhabdus mauleonii]PHM44804.1 monooxygenase family protein [Xenorhabdus mauleonii]SFJ20748.1 3-(3-hydroxy-phenyl)propionate hydroxylase [Xenorhabdus mauleonii]
MSYQQPHFSIPPPPKGGKDRDHLVIIVGAGLVGLTLALDLGLRGIQVVVLDEDDTVVDGSRAIVFARRSLEILSRLGLGHRLIVKGVAWENGTVYHKDIPLFRNSIGELNKSEYPAFLNLQQYYVEEWLVEACIATGHIEFRWKHKVIEIKQAGNYVDLDIATPKGNYTLRTNWLLACDGAKSFIRRSLNLPFIGQVFRDKFLIVDIRMKSSFPAERRFWFSPTFHSGQSVLMHKQPDNIWRIDFQLGWQANPEVERQEQHVLARLKSMFGDTSDIEVIWSSIYTFQCRRLEEFVHNNIIFVGDSAHQVSPFGGRGGNGGIQDADNLAWKLAAVLSGVSDTRLLETYNDERRVAADENILHSTRSAEFITPKNQGTLAYRDAVLALARTSEFARSMVNSGRLSAPTVLHSSPLNYPAGLIANKILPLGAPAPDMPLQRNGVMDWLLRYIGGNHFTLMTYSLDLNKQGKISLIAYPTTPSLFIELTDSENLLNSRYGISPGEAMLFRPDQHLCAHLVNPTPAELECAYTTALGQCFREGI